MRLETILLAALAAFTPALHAAAQEASGEAGSSACCGLFLPASGELVLEPEGEEGARGSSLRALVREYAKLTGQHLSYSGEVEHLLESQGHGIFPAPRIPAHQVQPWFEEILAAHGLALTVLRRSEPRLIEIWSVSSGGRSSTRSKAEFVAADQLEHMRAHAATLFATVVKTPTTDARQLTTSLRGLLTRRNTQLMVPVGDRQVLMKGFGGDLANLVEVLGAMDPELEPAPVPVVRSTARPELFGKASGDLEIVVPEGRPPTLQEIVERYLTLTGMSASINQETASLLAAVRPVHETVRIPASEVHSFVEHLLAAGDFVVTIIRAEEPRLIQIDSLTGSALSGVIERALPIDASEVPAYAVHPAVMVTVVLELPHLDARQLSTSLRGILTNTDTQRVVPFGDHGVTVTGFGSWVASCVEILRIVDTALSNDDELLTEVFVPEHVGVMQLFDAMVELVADPDVFPPTFEAGVDSSIAMSLDERETALVITANRERMAKLKELIAKIDAKSDPGK